jgi:hypothetical protein
VFYFNPKDLIVYLICLGVVIGRVCCVSIGAAVFRSISWSLASLCGVNILTKYFARISDFSLLLLAQDPAIGVVSRMGGENSFGFLLFLIGFQIG